MNPDVRINLVANGSSPCMDVASRGELEFGGRTFGMPHQSAVTIESCGADNLEIRSIEITAGGDAFSIPEGGLPDPLPGLLAAVDFARIRPFGRGKRQRAGGFLPRGRAGIHRHDGYRG